MTENEISKYIVNAAYKVHKSLGPGLLENAYEQCLFYELEKSALKVEKQKAIPLSYEEIQLDVGYRLDLLVENKVIIEIKAVAEFDEVHFAQILTYLRLSKCKLGLLINFNVELIKYGIKRFVNGL